MNVVCAAAGKCMNAWMAKALQTIFIRSYVRFVEATHPHWKNRTHAEEFLWLLLFYEFRGNNWCGTSSRLTAHTHTHHPSTISATIKTNADGNNAKVNLAVQFESIRKEMAFGLHQSWTRNEGHGRWLLNTRSIKPLFWFYFRRNQIMTFSLLIKYSRIVFRSETQTIIDGAQMTRFHPIHSLHVAWHSRCPAIGPSNTHAKVPMKDNNCIAIT